MRLRDHEGLDMSSFGLESERSSSSARIITDSLCREYDNPLRCPEFPEVDQ